VQSGCDEDCKSSSPLTEGGFRRTSLMEHRI
jgi:hypothetical protein